MLEIELNYFVNHLGENKPNISNIYQGLEVIKILEEASKQILKWKNIRCRDIILIGNLKTILEI